MGILPLKAILASTCIISMAVMLKLSLPLIQSFVFSELPLFWSFALSWLRPPYLYLIINCIIISIVASSKLQPRGDGGADAVTPASEKISSAKIPVEIAADMRGVAAMIEETKDEEEGERVVLFGYVESPLVKTKIEEVEHHVVSPLPLMEEIVVGDDAEERETAGDGDEVPMSKPPAVVEFSPVSSAEKPPFSARFGNRRAVKGSPEAGKQVLKVTKPKRRDTLESTWRTITDGRSMPLTRHLRKSDTFAGASPARAMKKSETFATASPSSSNGKMKREPSLSQDELNRRVEAFIKKFNEEMRLQRQDLVKQYREVVAHGAH